MPPIRRSELSADPIEQFRRWYECAEGFVALPQAMTLATVDAAGAPDARTVLLEGYGPDGFRLFTNYESRKARQLGAVPRAALVLYWRELDRQVRIRGPIERMSEAASDADFARRHRTVQVGAWASPQSELMRSRNELENRVRDQERRFREGVVPRPPFWGGYLLRPDEIELWQGQIDRLHDRLRYTRDGEAWRLDRLAP